MPRACVRELKTNKTCFFFAKVATPKQIRELMKVDGLTNDEVKSHLQVIIISSSIHPCTIMMQ
jgi:hypothetical protein